MAGKFLLNEFLNDCSKQIATGEDTGRAADQKKNTEYIQVSVYDLVPSKENFYSQTEIDKLKTAIELAGKVYQNLVAVPMGGGKYKVIAGHRRRLASIALVEEGKPEFEFVPCAIEETVEDAELQEIREELLLIYTNSQREKTAWDKIEEARRIRILFERMKEEKKIKGSVRALVAKELDISSGQAGRYETITKHLSDDFKQALKSDKINISSAVELAGLSSIEQQTAYEEYQATGTISIKDAKAKKQPAKPEQPEEQTPKCTDNPTTEQSDTATQDMIDTPAEPDTTDAERHNEPAMLDIPQKPTPPENQHKDAVISELLQIVHALESGADGCSYDIAGTCRKAAALLSAKE